MTASFCSSSSFQNSIMKEFKVVPFHAISLPSLLWHVTTSAHTNSFIDIHIESLKNPGLFMLLTDNLYLGFLSRISGQLLVGLRCIVMFHQSFAYAMSLCPFECFFIKKASKARG
jgi:hypothetical protein